jgi:guanylate kinase
VVTVVHLHGPSGAGKSTLAQRYVYEHPEVLNLDIDVVVSVFLLGPPAVFSLLAQVPCAAAGTHR